VERSRPIRLRCVDVGVFSKKRANSFTIMRHCGIGEVRRGRIQPRCKKAEGEQSSTHGSRRL
jgi:hypothetical protein